jgi:hypothetical protein
MIYYLIVGIVSIDYVSLLCYKEPCAARLHEKATCNRGFIFEEIKFCYNLER